MSRTSMAMQSNLCKTIQQKQTAKVLIAPEITIADSLTKALDNLISHTNRTSIGKSYAQSRSA